jgi:C4-dicarboxylate-specific signal transduction histidine kinase
MALEKTSRKLPLRDLLTETEKRSRDTAEKLGNAWLSRVTDLRDLSRPLRRKSHYPTLLALQNAVYKALETTREVDAMVAYLEQALTEIRDHARREKFNRS